MVAGCKEKLAFVLCHGCPGFRHLLASTKLWTFLGGKKLAGKIFLKNLPGYLE